MVDPESSKKKRLRDSSVVIVATTALTVISMEVFSHYHVPLAGQGENAAAETAVVAGFWFLIIGTGAWIWNHFHRS